MWKWYQDSSIYNIVYYEIVPSEIPFCSFRDKANFLARLKAKLKEWKVVSDQVKYLVSFHMP